MQSPNTGPNPVTTATTGQPLDTETEAQPAQSEPDVHEKEDKSAAPAGNKTPIAPQENGTVVQTAELPANMADTQAVENQPAVQPLTEPPDNTGGMETDSASKPSAPTDPVPDTNTNPVCDGQKAKKQDKAAQDGRKYIPSKKAMVDPLKMDMSKPLVVPLTSSQFSLQCMECHIIFSDHKSKERHLKLSHPAEYEQCILRNALFACYVCDRHFTNSTDLLVHQKAHTEKKPFKCPICGQAFNKSSELTHHKKVHYGRDGYACTDCGKPCKTMTLLKYHRRTHTGERPYICKECGKRFTMSKALQKHMVSHLKEGAEGDGGDTTAEVQLRKDDGASTKYPCSVCKATFKSTKTLLHHMKTKHNALSAAASNAPPAGQQVKQNTPIITPLSICQPALLQLEPNGPLQKVDANIDTEQIRRLIESLGNVQKVNQVVILGQVPPNAPPLEVQQISQMAEPVSLNLNPPQIDFMGLKQTQSKTLDLDPSNNPCDAMETTIILEPITPDGQFESPSFSALGSHIATDSDINDESETGKNTSKPETSCESEASKVSASASAPAASLPSIPSTLEESAEEQATFELQPLTAGVEEVINERGLQGGEEHRCQSPAVILETFLAGRYRATADEQPCLTARNNQRQDLNSIAENEGPGSQDIKVEENISDPTLVAPNCQNRQGASVQPQHHHRDIRTVLVKEESCLVLHEAQDSRHIRWNVEPVNNENTSSPLMESGETTRDCCITPEFNTSQCVFYPVKEEEREVPLGASSDAQQTEHHPTDSNLNEGSHSAPNYQEMRVRGLLSEPGVTDFADGQAEADAEHPPDLRDFLLQSSDEEDVGGFELSDPQLDSETEVMAYFYKNQTTPRQPDEVSQKYSIS
ncbi:uncharacterized protein [Pempheris klunzingeri]|uniref:uncharacterized protein n=1 Tax=Pempheris klunzingeri TaxID=3127111 RepID=UPI003980CFDB